MSEKKQQWSLTKHEDWVMFDLSMRESSRGNGISSLKAALPDDDCAFVFFRLMAKNVGNTGADVTTEANLVLQWKGSKASAMKKVKSGTNLDGAVKQCPSNKGFIEVISKGKNLTTDIIYDRWRPGSGSKVIDD